MGALGLFFWVGDRGLREFAHLSFGNSMLVWAGVLSGAVAFGMIAIYTFDR